MCLQVGSRKLIMSVPYEMGRDSEDVLAAAQATGFVTASRLRAVERWDDGRINKVIMELMREGMCWVDTQASEPQYWFPSCVSRS